MNIKFLFQPAMVNLTRQRPVKLIGGFLSVDRGKRGLEAVALWPTTRSKNEITKTRIILFLIKAWWHNDTATG